MRESLACELGGGLRFLAGLMALSFLLAAACAGTGQEPGSHGDLKHRVEGVPAITFPGTNSSRQGVLAHELSEYLWQMSGVRPALYARVKRDGLGRVSSSHSTVIQLLLDGEGEAEDYSISAETLDGRKVYRIVASSRLGLAYGTYAFLERLGVRFFHPEDEVVPKQSGGLYLPDEVAVEASPAVKVRAWHAHTLHSIEYNPLLLEPTESHLPMAKKLVKWLLKTRQNRLAFQVLNNINFERWFPYMEELIGYAHDWVLQVVAEVIMWQGSSLQNSYVFVDDPDNWEQEMHERVDYLMQLPWDGLLFWSGEFLSSDAEAQLKWINTLTEYVSDQYPGVEVGAEIHVGNYEDTLIWYEGEEMLYYYLPKYADPRLAVYVHTVMLYNLYDPAFGTYGHEDFSSHHEFLISQLGQRRVYYYPESAYWCSFDIDVPLFLPVYAESRVRELETLLDDVEDAGGGLEGLQLFSSGHEWGYWLTDYIFARALYEGRVGLEDHVAHVAKGFGHGAPVVESVLLDLMYKQRHWFLENNLLPYLAAEDLYDDVGWTIDVDTHPKRLTYTRFAALSHAEQDAIKRSDLKELEEMAQFFAKASDDLKSQKGGVPEAAIHYLDELWLATKLLSLRALHARALYLAVYDSERGQAVAAEGRLAEAERLEGKGIEIVREVEAIYRYDLSIYIERYENHTIYPWGYLAQAHDLCFWRRQRLQAEGLVIEGQVPGMMELPSCID